MDKEYWESYYSKNAAPKEPSLFAKWVYTNYLAEHNRLLELGCGNGRDSVFFASNGINVTAIDQSEYEIAALKKNNVLTNLTYKAADFTKYRSDVELDSIYSRFTLHSITEFEEDRVLKYSYSHLKNGGLILIEVRGQKNEYYMKGEKVEGESNAYIYENHYRRFISFEEINNKLKRLGFDILYANEDKGFAPYKGTDQTFIRVVAKKTIRH